MLVNASQLQVDGHRMDHVHLQLGPVGRSEDPGSLILENHDEFYGVQEISINYISSGELFDHNTTIVISCFWTIVVGLLNDHEPMTMAECKQHSYWTNGRKRSRHNLERYPVM
jgi:hypothetical protein